MNNFGTKHANMLLKYKTYLLYNVDITIESQKGFKAINYFLDKVGPISSDFFHEINIKNLGVKSIEVYNKFIVKYLEKGFNINVIKIELDDFLNSYQDTEEFKDVPMLEYLDYDFYPYFDMKTVPAKVVNSLSITNSSENHEYTLDGVKCSFNCLVITLENAKYLHDNKYKFKDESCKRCNKILIDFSSKTELYLNDQIHEWIKYFIEMFPLVRTVVLRGDQIEKNRFFTTVKYIQSIDSEEKIDFIYEAPESFFDEAELKYDENVFFEDESKINLKSKHILDNNPVKIVEFAYHNLKSNITFTASTDEVSIKFMNDRWIQIGDYVYITNFYDLSLKRLKFTENKHLSNLIQKFKEDDKFDVTNSECIFLIKIHYKMIPTKFHDTVRIENIIKQDGHTINIHYLGTTDEDLQNLINQVQSMDKRHPFSIYIRSPVVFTSDLGKNLLKSIPRKKLERFSYDTAQFVLNDKETEALIRMLQKQETHIDSLCVKIEQEKYVKAILKTFENRHYIDYCEIKTSRKIPKEAEEQAIKILHKNIGSAFELNSNHKLCRSMNCRGIVKYYVD